MTSPVEEGSYYAFGACGADQRLTFHERTPFPVDYFTSWGKVNIVGHNTMLKGYAGMCQTEAAERLLEAMQACEVGKEFCVHLPVHGRF
ncbi:unnamed protein product [Vitrella brassicaformis CCMP3155]|uniref:Uncharacterized protein n=1 Tax=Vitrella brassicaformis (strain CCMP3155) TaxID=1169540 RepID=A0A0G4GVJ2_VITBC|nr:unnamed protein product [Vitrella brassicaformis CCMP3155]|eukprot:CEM34832.1 unnamed protein product [Vitrella brassicaformis CCMP3155]